MKVYGKSSHDKSWALQLNALSHAEASLDAVDSETGDKIAIIMDFSSSGKVTLMSSVKKVLEEEGYDPYEHGNGWTPEGYLIVLYEITNNRI